MKQHKRKVTIPSYPLLKMREITTELIETTAEIEFTLEDHLPAEVASPLLRLIAVVMTISIFMDADANMEGGSDE